MIYHRGTDYKTAAPIQENDDMKKQIEMLNSKLEKDADDEEFMAFRVKIHQKHHGHHMVRCEIKVDLHRHQNYC